MGKDEISSCSFRYNGSQNWTEECIYGYDYKSSGYTTIAMEIVIISSSNLLIEFFDSTKRGFVGTMCQFGAIFSMLLLVTSAYLIKNWRHLSLFTSTTSALWIVLVWFLPESPIWLAAQKREKETEEVLKNIAKLNGVKYIQCTKYVEKNSEYLLELDTKREDEENEKERQESKDNRMKENRRKTKYNFIDLFKHKCLIKHMIITALLWFVNNCIYYGLTLSTPALAGDRFFNFSLSVLVEIPAYAIAALFATKFGRRMPVFGFLILTGSTVIIVSVLPKVLNNENLKSKLVLAFFQLGKFSISSAFSITVIFTKELFPTTLRSSGLGVANTFGGIGAMAAPICAHYAANKYLNYIPPICYGILAFIAAFAIILLPETERRPLPQTIDEIEEWYKSKKGSAA
ncbi:DgyrCDS2096 [Dimorphilus gyrociliatus]|uniref:DgyrCDS2096 n=1 Tax=Dimorphilus gyrociliatus TaxID=2664684 RepID=A0A7I8V976_9ANNE|nr:DgyrCDS2096 [Dimorphilus gyrociliatus]